MQQKIEEKSESPEEFQERRKNERLLLFISVAISSIYIIQDFFTHESLYDISANWTVRIQNSGSSGLKFFMQFASNGSLAIMGACISYLLFAYPDRARIFSLIWYFATCTWLMSYLKLLYSDPRPYMSYVKIEGMECAPEYGNPSGHSFLNCFFYLVFPWLIYPRIFHFVERRESETGSGYETHFNWGRIAVVFSMIGWILLIGYSRIYLGVHSINQVLLGFVIGTLTASIFILEVSEKSDKFFTKITNASKELKHKYLLIYFAPIAAFIIIATNVTYVIVMQVYPLTESPSLGYIINIDLTKSCQSKLSTLNSKYLYQKCFVDSGIIGAALGAFFFVLMFNGEYKPGLYYKNYKRASIKTRIYRALIVGAILLLNIGFLFLMFSLKPILGEQKLIYVRFYIEYLLGTFLAMSGLIIQLPLTLRKFNLDIEGDYYRILSPTSESEDETISQENSSITQKLRQDSQTYVQVGSSTENSSVSQIRAAYSQEVDRVL